MFKLNPKQILLKQPSIYDMPGFAKPDQRLQILRKKMLQSSSFQLKGGTSLTNPYKEHQDIILAERMELAEYYKKSILWSPKYTPWHFKNLFLYPSFFVVFLLLYLTYIALPKKMIRLKKKGYTFPELEAKGWLDGWEDNEDIFYSQQQDPSQFYKDWTIRDLQSFENQGFKVGSKLTVSQQAEKMQDQRIKNNKIKMQTNLNDIYNQREIAGLNISK